MKDRNLFGFAGLWERWKDKASGEALRTFTIITTAPNELCAPLHDRMPREP
jgi:putative SOS response-associated peptidase YedK